MFFTLTSTFIVIPPLIFHIHVFILTSTFIIIPHFLPPNLHLHLHEICSVIVLDSFTPVIMLNTLRFKSSVLFGTYTLLDKSFRVSQLPTHLFNLNANG